MFLIRFLLLLLLFRFLVWLVGFGYRPHFLVVWIIVTLSGTSIFFLLLVVVVLSFPTPFFFFLFLFSLILFF